MIRVVLALTSLACMASTIDAQSTADPAAALAAWRSTHGGSWNAELDARTGFVRSLYGGHTGATLRLRDDRAAMDRARSLVNSTAALTGIDAATLVDDYALFLPLSTAGSSDKYTARFRQVVRGVSVVGGSVNVLMDLEGRGLSVESAAVPGSDSARTTPVHAEDAAIGAAVAAFARIAGLPGEVRGGARLVLDQVILADSLRAELAWEIDVHGSGNPGIPRGLRLRIADSDLRVTSQEELVHAFDVSGTVYTMRTPGTLPDSAANPPIQTPMSHVQVSSPQGNAVTDAAGNFVIVGASPPLQVTVAYDGPWTTTLSHAGPTYSLQANLTQPSGNTLLMNPAGDPWYTAEANSAHWIGALRDYVRGVNPTDVHADFDTQSHVNWPCTCNAYYTGNSVDFQLAGAGCANSAYSTIVAHEMGHWMNDRYNSGNSLNGFGEGCADAWALYLTDQPTIGEKFFGNSGSVRSGWNQLPFCGDAVPSCHGGMHTDGQVLMGALWKVRAHLKYRLGDSAGSAAADTLFNSWMNAYDDGEIKTIIRTHWLVLDDDDGNLNNGTPNYAEIDRGFVDQGFPSYAPSAVSISALTQLPNTENEAGPYVVFATAVANFAPPLSMPSLFWRVDGGAFSSVPMAPLTGNVYRGLLPGHASPAKLEYYVTATDALGRPGFAPEGAPATLQRFIVGDEGIYYSDTFEGGLSTWQSGSASGTDDWTFLTPTGRSGDPHGPKSGLRCWGNDSGFGSSDGAYPANASNWVQSPSIDLSNCAAPRLRFQRWLNVEDGQRDHARILVNGQLVWENPPGADLIDSAWTEVELDLTAVAAGHPSTRIRFELVSDGAVQKGGWNVDDVQIVTLRAVGEGCMDPISYCSGKLTSIGTLPYLTAVGSVSASLSNLEIALRQATLGKAGILFHSAAGRAATPFQGGTLCVQPPIQRDSSFITDMFGYAQIPVPVNANMVGQTWYLQAWFRDPPASFGSGLSNAVQILFCE